MKKEKIPIPKREKLPHIFKYSHKRQGRYTYKCIEQACKETKYYDLVSDYDGVHTIEVLRY